jgi:hypothetical protein
MSIKRKSSFVCEYCDYICCKRYDYNQHVNTKKHEKTRQKIEKTRQETEKTRQKIENNHQNIENTRQENGKTRQENGKTRQENGKTRSTSVKTILTTYCCDYCEFSTTIKKESEKHRKSKQHIENENKEEYLLEIVTQYTCLSCDKCFINYKTCWGHSKRCREKINEKKENIIVTVVEKPAIKTEISMETIVEKILDNNKHMMEQIVSVVKTVLMETQIQSHHSITQNNNTLNNNNTQNNNTLNNNNTQNNNHCTINMFLNDKCKDALNVTDWVNNLILDFDNLRYNAENGFQKGLTKMLIDNLKLYNIYQRPIHFTDVKRDTMYIKDDDIWTKHENRDKLIEVFEQGARQGIQCFVAWMEENAPAYHDLDSHLGKLYMKIHQTVIRPSNDRTKAYSKIIKDVATATQLRKEDQITR